MQTLGSCPFSRRDMSSHTKRQLQYEDLTPVESQIPEASDTNDPLVVSNDNFHTNYDYAKSELLPPTHIMPESDYLVLYLQNGSRIKEEVNTMYFHNLKMVSHLPLNAYIILLVNTTRSIQLPAETLSRLEEFLAMLYNITLDRSDFLSDDQYERQVQIYNDTVTFVSTVTATQLCSYMDMANFAWSMSAASVANLDDAAEAQMNRTHEIVMRWKEELITPSEWDDLYTATSSGCV